jgi:hypothetical protein
MWLPSSGAVRGIALSLLLVLAGGCATSKERDGEPRERRSRSRSIDASPSFVEMNLAAPARDVRSIQLFLGDDERQPPIVGLRSPQSLTLRFDVIEAPGRPLSVYFYHADRRWRRDLSPAEYLASFQRDDILDFTPSRLTNTRYTHYAYRFPNASVEFLISGNYVLRVTEQGQEDDVLFERAFFVTEQSAPVEMGAQSVLMGSGGYPATLPVARFSPPNAMAGDVYNYEVCFVRNGRYDFARCTDRPVLTTLPSLQFHLQPEYAFEPEPADYFVDLGTLRSSGRIEAVDLGTVPYRVRLEADYARFPGTPLAPQLNGQPVIGAGVRDVGEPNVSAEYVSVQFGFVPPNEEPLESEIIVIGSFNGWRYDPDNRLTWIPERGRYEGDIVLKQGQYEYQYFSADRRLRQMLASAPPRNESLYSAFVYYTDLRVNTDRLLSVGLTTAP